MFNFNKEKYEKTNRQKLLKGEKIELGKRENLRYNKP